MPAGDWGQQGQQDWKEEVEESKFVPLNCQARAWPRIVNHFEVGRRRPSCVPDNKKQQQQQQQRQQTLNHYSPLPPLKPYPPLKPPFGKPTGTSPPQCILYFFRSPAATGKSTLGAAKAAYPATRQPLSVQVKKRKKTQKKKQMHTENNRQRKEGSEDNALRS